jgi:hypothetical protein
MAVRPLRGRSLCRAHRGIVQDAVRRIGGIRVLGLTCPHSGTTPLCRGQGLLVREDLSGDLPVQAGASAICRRGAGAQVAAVVGAEVVAAREGFSADETIGASCGRTPGSLALMACPRPSSGDVGEGLVTAASALRSLLLLFSRPKRGSLSLLVQRSPASRLEFVIPRAPWCGGCSYPRERNRSPVRKEIYRVFAGAKCNFFKYLDICRRSGEPPRVLLTSKSV